jgi:hypothetical protein
MVDGIVVNGTGLNLPTPDGTAYAGVAGLAVTPMNGQTVSPTAYLDSQGNNSATIDLDLSAAGVTGQYQVALTAFGVNASSPQTFTVADTTPVITGITPISPLYSGGQAYVQIFGTNFGPACMNNLPCQGAGIAICQDGSPDPCAPTGTNVDVSGRITYWSNSQVNALLSAGSGASGYYDIVLMSAGASGTGFVPVPGGGTGSVSNRAKTPVNPPNLNLQVQVNVNGTNQPLSVGACAYIPQCRILKCPN